MKKKSQNKNEVIHATKEGRMYIKSKDFFQQEKVKKLITKLEDSSIFQKIQKNKQNELETA